MAKTVGCRLFLLIRHGGAHRQYDIRLTGGMACGVLWSAHNWNSGDVSHSCSEEKRKGYSSVAAMTSGRGQTNRTMTASTWRMVMSLGVGRNDAASASNAQHQQYLNKRTKNKYRRKIATYVMALAARRVSSAPEASGGVSRNRRQASSLGHRRKHQRRRRASYRALSSASCIVAASSMWHGVKYGNVASAGEKQWRKRKKSAKSVSASIISALMRIAPHRAAAAHGINAPPRHRASRALRQRVKIEENERKWRAREPPMARIGNKHRRGA